MTLPWKRFWVPLGSEISCGMYGDGFFDDPDESWGYRNKAVAHTLEDLLHKRCLFLSGEPGLGKSIALERAFPGIDHAAGGDGSTIWIRFRDIPDASTFTRRVFDSERWRSWRNNALPLTLVLDGLDEGLIKIKDFLSFLAAELRTAPLDRLHLVIACRTADWPTAAGNRLLNLWEGSSAKNSWELCPLRRVDVEVAAKHHGIEPKLLFEQIFAKNVTTLAARPTTLFFLVRQFATNGKLEGTHREIYERGILDLCREPDPERAEGNSVGKQAYATTAEETRDAAGYLAAMLILSGQSAISTGERDLAASQRDLHFESLLAFPSSESFADRRSTLAALETALFSSRGENRFGFTHQTFAECLAARRVSRLPLIQLRKLFCGIDRTEEHIIPQLAETAAWLAGINDEFLQHVLNVDPEVLLRSDIARIQGNRKRQVVDAILERAKRQELFDDIGLRRFLSGLKHDHLTPQLWNYIKDNSLNIIVRRLALEIAEECQISDLEEELLALLREEGVVQQVREGAARVLEKTLPDGRLGELEPFAKGEGGPDPDDQMKGCALRRLIPKHWAVAHALEYLTPPQRGMFHGSYHAFLSHQGPDSLTKEDVPRLLTFLSKIDHCFDTLNPFCELAHRGMCLALLSLDDSQIGEATVGLWLEKRRKYEHPRGGHGIEELVALWANSAIRRGFAFKVFEDARTTDDDLWTLLFDSFALLKGEDLPWLLEILPTVSADRLSLWANVVGALARPEDIARCWDFFLQRIEEIPALRSRFSWLRAWDLGEPEARKAKAQLIRNERMRRRFQRKRQEPNRQELIASDLEMIASGKSWAWINLCYNLSLKDGETYNQAVPRHDITAGPGWEAANEEQRAIIKEAAKKYLLLHSDGFNELASRTNFSDPGYIAVWLLRDNIERDNELRTAVSTKWINAIVGYFNNAEEHYQEMVAIAYRLNADATIDVLLREVEDDYQQHGYIFAWRGFKRCWNSQLSAMLTSFSLDHSTSEKTLISSLCVLFEHDLPAFQKWMRSVLPRSHRFSEGVRVTILAIAHALTPSETWLLVWPAISADPKLGAKVLLKVASELEFEARKTHLDLDPLALGNLAGLLHEIFPPDAEVERMRGIVTPRQAVADYRREVSDALTASSSFEAGDALIRLANKFPDRSTEFMWRHRDHLKTRRRTLWQPPSPSELSEILSRSEARFVTSEQDLFDVTLESLQRFEIYYTRKELPAVERLWRWEKDGNRRLGFQPKDEEDFSDEIARWFDDDLGKGAIIIGREVQIERKMRTDLLVKAAVRDPEGNARDPLTIVVEVKGCWNRGVRTDAEDQLVQKYLLPHGWSLGIYVVGWFVCESWQHPRNCLEADVFEAAREEVSQIGDHVAAAHPDLKVASILLDCRYR